MLIKSIAPKELPSSLVFRLNYLYKTELGDFVAITDREEKTLYVNHTVPQKDIERFLEVITFPHYWVNDPDCGKEEFLDHVCEKYGYEVYRILIDAHRQYLEKREKRRAEEVAKVIIPLIEKEVNSETPVVEYDEYLSSAIWKHGFQLERKTLHTLSNYGNVYLFYFGYLMGSGMVKGGAV